MSAAIRLREDFGAAELRPLAGRTKNANQARRLLALAAVYGGKPARGGSPHWRHGSPDAAGLGASVQPVRA